MTFRIQYAFLCGPARTVCYRCSYFVFTVLPVNYEKCVMCQFNEVSWNRYPTPQRGKLRDTVRSFRELIRCARVPVFLATVPVRSCSSVECIMLLCRYTVFMIRCIHFISIGIPVPVSVIRGEVNSCVLFFSVKWKDCRYRATRGLYASHECDTTDCIAGEIITVGTGNWFSQEIPVIPVWPPTLSVPLYGSNTGRNTLLLLLLLSF